MLLPGMLLYCWLVLLPTYVVDIMSTYCNMRRCYWLMLLPYMIVVDVITTKADVIACYILFFLILMADVIAN